MILIAFLTLPILEASAQGYTPKYLPRGERINPGSPTEVVCFKAPDYRLLLLMDFALVDCEKKSILLDEKVVEQDKIIINFRKIDVLQKDSIDMLKAENARLFELWKEENKKRHEAENVPKWGNALAWAVAGVGALAAGGAITYSIVK